MRMSNDAVAESVRSCAAARYEWQSRDRRQSEKRCRRTAWPLPAILVAVGAVRAATARNVNPSALALTARSAPIASLVRNAWSFLPFAGALAADTRSFDGIRPRRERDEHHGDVV
jgi:hypothetical protein